MKAPARKRFPDWLIITALLLLSAVPVVGGAFRLTDLAGGNVTANNARFFASPTPVILHIISVTLFAVLGAFQFAPNLRKKRRKWHKLSGRIVMPSGLIAALSGLWMTQFYPWPEFDGEALYVLRLIFGSAMVLSIALSFDAIRQRNFKAHGAWMLRAYAIGLGAGTQVFTHIPWFIFPELQNELTRTLCMAAGWIINIVIAELIIRTRMTHSKHKPNILIPQAQNLKG